MSFEVPGYANADALGALRILEAIKFHKLKKKQNFTKLGLLKCLAKFKAFLRLKKQILSFKSIWCCEALCPLDYKNYREAYNIFGSNGILFNHESPRRGETFVTKKIIKALVRIKMGYQKNLILGIWTLKRLGTCRVMWKQCGRYFNKKPDDYVIATGKQYSIRQFINFVVKKLNMKIVWKGKGLNEVGYDV